jgi:hypothetical protein
MGTDVIIGGSLEAAFLSHTGGDSHRSHNFTQLTLALQDIIMILDG